MRVCTHGENLLYELARTLAAGNDHSTAIALRKLVQAGYTTLEQLDGVPDWILLSIPGIGVKRLGAVRRLTRPDWQPPSPRAIQATKWYLSAVRFALRFWSPDILATVVRGSKPGVEAEQPVGARLALDVFTRAANEALRYCDAQELMQPVHQAGNGSSVGAWPVPRPSDDINGLPEARSHLQSSPSATSADPTSGPEGGNSGQRKTSVVHAPSQQADQRQIIGNSQHFAFSVDRRREIVAHYRAAWANGEVANKDQWARTNHNISGKTLLRYEREFPDDPLPDGMG